MSAADLEEFRPPIIKTRSDGADAFCTDGDCGVETPKTPEQHAIPPVLVCPPAPRKPAARRRVAATCKRKFRQLKFFEIVSRDEIESFFRKAEEEFINGRPNKKRCVM